MTGGGNAARLPYTLSPYHESSLYTVSLSRVFLIHCLLTRLPYTLSPYHSSSLYTVSFSLVFLIHCHLISPLPHNPVFCSWFIFPSACCFLWFVPGLFSRLFAAFCCLFLVRFSVCLLLSVVCSWFVFSPVCCFLLFVLGLIFRLFAAFCCLFLVCFSVSLLLSVVCSWFVFPSVCCFLLFACCEWTGGTRPSSPASSPGSSIRRLFRNDNKTAANKLKRDTSDTEYILLNWLQSLNRMDGPFQHLVCVLLLLCVRFVFKS